MSDAQDKGDAVRGTAADTGDGHPSSLVLAAQGTAAEASSGYPTPASAASLGAPAYPAMGSPTPPVVASAPQRPRLRPVHLTARAAAWLAAGAVPALLLPGRWAVLGALAWALAWALVVRGDVHASGRPGEFEVERTLPAKLSIGVPNTVTLTLRNLGRRVLVLEARETPPSGFEGERALGFVRLGPFGEQTVALSLTPPSRGAFRFGDLGVRTLGPRGLGGERFLLPLAEDVRVYPDITAIDRYALLARRGMLHEIGVKAARFAGAGTEFESLAEYQQGDEYRAIDWKATARRGEPVVRRFEAERSQTVVLAVDAGRLMTPRVGSLTKLDRAVNAALLLTYLAEQAGDLTGLLVFGREVRVYLPPRKGHRQFLAILDALHAVDGRLEEPDYASALRYLAVRLPKRSLVVLFTDLAGAQPSRRLLDVLGTLSPRHLPLVVTQRNRDLEARAVAPVGTESEAFAAAVAEDALRDKEAALRVLRSRGALVLDVHPEALSVAAVNRYLEIKARGRL